MRSERYWQLCLLMPLLVPTCAAAVVFSWPDSSSVFVQGICLYLFESLVFGGIPYVLTAAVAFVLLRGRPVRSYMKASLAAPIIFALVVEAPVVVFVVASDGIGSHSVGETSPFLFNALLLGYFYVGVAHLGYWLLERRGALQQPADG